MSLRLAAAVALLGAGCVKELGDTDAPPLDGPAPCPAFDDPEPIATVTEPALDEVSGIVASRAHEGVFWVHNDSGDTARFFAIDRTGALRGTYLIDSARAIDFEDNAIGPGPDGTTWLYIGDIGDNRARRDEIVVWGLPEPQALEGSLSLPTMVQATPYRFVYPDGPRDAETLLVEPDGSFVVISKSRTGQSGVYRAPAPQQPDQTRTLEKIHEIILGIEPIAGDLMATGGDLTPDGRTFVLRTYLRVWLWTLAQGEPLEQALLRPPCPAPPPPERQGEAIGFDVDPPTFYTLSEGIGQPLFRVQALP